MNKSADTLLEIDADLTQLFDTKWKSLKPLGSSIGSSEHPCYFLHEIIAVLFCGGVLFASGMLFAKYVL